ncbi:helix-turn-helix domain-containing protein [Candidatus Binatus sp.]|uniref:helix-turn-helix domain-containing protein n=1 Tax=Candidatus Binatus sp. TaxID=2811406 RepID=UPI00351D080B
MKKSLKQPDPHVSDKRLAVRRGQALVHPRSFVERLNQVMLGRNVADIAKKIGASRATLYKWFGGREPSLANLAAFAKATNVSLSWLIAGEGPRNLGELPGYLAPNSIRAPVPVAFERGWLRETFGPEWIVTSEDLAEGPRKLVRSQIVQVQDDSMHPTLLPGDLLLCSLDEVSRETTPPNGIYAVRLFGSKEMMKKFARDFTTERLVPRRVEWRSNRRGVIRCDNTAYPTATEVADGYEKNSVAGRVVLRITKV